MPNVLLAVHILTAIKYKPLQLFAV